MDADSYLIYLKSGDDIANESGYHMWKQRFPVKQENKVDVRREVEEWVVTLAFPIEKRRQGSSRCPGIYAFLPTDTVTYFPFIIQADFLLASSRENILWDNKWNQGILDCVPDAFIDAFTTLVKSIVNAPVSSLPQMFRFLPITNPSHPKLKRVQDSIKEKLMNEAIVPCESLTSQKLFRKPREVYRLPLSFWSILNAAKSQHVSFRATFFSQGASFLTSSFDGIEYYSIHNFLEIRDLDPIWYAQCIVCSNIVKGVSDDVYLQLLVFIAENWESLQKTNFKTIPLIKYTGLDGNVELFTLNDVSIAYRSRKLLAGTSSCRSWLNQWNKEFSSSMCPFFLSEVIQMECKKNYLLKKWLVDVVKVKFVSVYEYAGHLIPSLNRDTKLTVTYAHFLHISLKNKFLSETNVRDLCSKMPIADNYGQVIVRRINNVLLPAYRSKWVELTGPNFWTQHGYVELANDYTRPVSYFGEVTSHEELICFVQEFLKASDIPYLSPPNASVPTMSSPLTRSNTFLLLSWLKNLRTTGTCLPELFLSSIKNGSWLKIYLNGCSGYKSPSESFMLESSLVNHLHNESVHVDIPLIDEKFYGDEIKNYKDELKTIGVGFDIKEACEFTGKHLMSLAASSELTKDGVFAILKFIKYLGENKISSEGFISSINGGEWVRTSRGYMAPTDSVLLSDEWNAAMKVSDVPFIDHDFYGNEIFSFKKELELLGMLVNFDHNCYQIVSDNIKSSTLLTCLSPEAFLLILKCIQKLESSDKLLEEVKNSKCLKTNLGYKCPTECFLWNPKSEWCCLLHVFRSFPVLDETFYGNIIVSMSAELKKLGVMVESEDTIKEFTRTFKQQASSSLISKENVFSFLECCRKFNKTGVKFPSELKDCIQEEKWLRTKLGDYKSPNDCILFGTDWFPISSVALLPFIDDSDDSYGSQIRQYGLELKELGVTTDFKDGDKFFADGIFLPEDCSRLTTASVYSLLDSVKIFKEKKVEIPAKLLDKLSQKKWLKTKCGYKSPDDCLLFHSEWEPFLNQTDGPFIDEEFYESGIGSYKQELDVLGVTTVVNNGCRLLASCLNFHSDFEIVCRIYNYLSEFKWELFDDDNRKIWIPKGTNNGEWARPQDCVVHDNDNLFGEKFFVLEKFKYEEKFLDFFANILHVKVHPSVSDYCNLWKVWEDSGCQITHTECCAFWEFVVKNWNSGSKDTFDKFLTRIPVLDPYSDKILLINKRDVFIGDDLFLTELFQRFSRPIFVWYPQPSLKGLTRTKLLDIYRKLGIRTLSKSVRKIMSNVDQAKFERINPRENIITKGLLKLILGFLAKTCLEFDKERRHEAVSRILAMEAFATEELMTIRNCLSFSSGDMINVEEKRMIHWDKLSNKFFLHKLDRSSSFKNFMTYASHFSEVMVDGMLCENEEHVTELSELIRSGFLVEFDEEAVDFLMKTKKLEILMEDQDYISNRVWGQFEDVYQRCPKRLKSA